MRLGGERALIYKALFLTGLRKYELASLTVGQLHVDGAQPLAELLAADEKNRQGSNILVRTDLAADLRAWLKEKKAAMQDAARFAGNVDPAPEVGKQSKRGTSDASGFGLNTPVLVVPSGLVGILDRDLKKADIPKRDERDRTTDVHTTRHSFNTFMASSGVPLRVAHPS